MKQLNKNNIGITNDLPGYQSRDAMYFGSEHETYKDFAKGLLELYPSSQSILEIGSGAGSLAYHLRTLNPNLLIVTLDGNIESSNQSPFLEKKNHFVVKTDVDYTITNDDESIIKFDLIISFEHLEHISKETFGVFIDNIKKHSKPGTYYHFSAANWNGGYSPHINIKTKEEWDTLFVSNGFSVVTNKHLFGKYTHPFNLLITHSIELTYKI